MLPASLVSPPLRAAAAAAAGSHQRKTATEQQQQPKREDATPGPEEGNSNNNSGKGGEQPDPDYSFFFHHLTPDPTRRSYTLRLYDSPLTAAAAPPPPLPLLLNYEAPTHNNNDDDDHEMWGPSRWKATVEKPRHRDCDSPVAAMDSAYLQFLRGVKIASHPAFPAPLQSEEEEEAQQREPAKRPKSEEDIRLKHGPHASCDHCCPCSHHPPPTVTSTSSGRRRRRRHEMRLPSSSFRSRLKENLGRPFSVEEYSELMESATIRKPIVRYKRLRSDDIPYETDEQGASYFDHFPDLARKVRSADECRGLVLLRGFFFWLENLEDEGAYQPWV